MTDFLRNIIRLALFILVQVYILNKIPHLHRFISPYLYYLFILWLPFSVRGFSLLIIGFITGLILDYFMMTPGLHAAACVLIAFVRPIIIRLLMPKDSVELNYREPSAKAMGLTQYAVYILILTLFHHGYMLFLEWLDFGSFFEFLIKVISNSLISLLLIFTVELLIPRRLKFRTNVS